MTKLTRAQRDALIRALENGGAWYYSPGRSFAWSAARSRCISKLRFSGLLDDHDKITEAGRKALIA